VASKEAWFPAEEHVYKAVQPHTARSACKMYSFPPPSITDETGRDETEHNRNDATTERGMICNDTNN
jgi:hypothetical protein